MREYLDRMTEVTNIVSRIRGYGDSISVEIILTSDTENDEQARITFLQLAIVCASVEDVYFIDMKALAAVKNWAWSHLTNLFNLPKTRKFGFGWDNDVARLARLTGCPPSASDSSNGLNF